MSEKARREELLEHEHGQLPDRLTYRFGLDRRDLFRVLGGGVAVALVSRGAIAFQESGGGQQGADGDMPQDIGSWLHIAADGTVTVLTGKVEVGQNSRTSLSQVVAEELRVPVTAVRMIMGDTDLTPFDRGTYGSLTTPTMVPQLRRVAATARGLLLDLAAERWNTDRSELTIEAGRITSEARGQTVGIGELVDGRELVGTVPSEVALTDPTSWTAAGQPVGKIDGREFVTGAHEYPSDVTLPGMLHGKVLRPPAFGATLASVDLTGAESMPGVTAVRDGEFVGVAAPTEEEAADAIAAVRAEWTTTPQPGDREFLDRVRSTVVEGNASGFPRRPAREETGSVERGLAEADELVERTYTVAYVAHAPLEPRVAVAAWDGGKLTAWTGTQVPFGVRNEMAEAFRLPQDRVRVIMPDTGSGYGGKHTGEAAVEAARLARAAGKPVRVMWTREEEFTWAYFRPGGVIDVVGGVRADGTLTAWEFHAYNSGPASMETLYDVPNRHIQYHPTQQPLRQGPYRGLAATANHFARESHMDELAHVVGIDPLEFRLRNLSDDRQRAVLIAAAEEFGWDNRVTAPGVGCGIACGYEKGSYIAICAEVSVSASTGEVGLTRIVAAFECGAIINPDQLENQVEGAIVMGIGGALFEAVEFNDGRVLNPRFSQYRVPRFADVPEIKTILIDRQDLPPAGAGETPIVGIAPAIGNAIFEATGVRLRSLPMVPNGLDSTGS
ncbi:MAG: xanthine dehydrogenase family protein molybdopterin-binding subunit [Acidobacteria bacterium]|nr:xanthine dehydrogenase family protein molybdopterin-binding subunit [Acidobacteriota bacterium]